MLASVLEGLSVALVDWRGPALCWGRRHDRRAL